MIVLVPTVNEKKIRKLWYKINMRREIIYNLYIILQRILQRILQKYYIFKQTYNFLSCFQHTRVLFSFSDELSSLLLV